jgi:glycosyltransferase 2 family protein
VTGAWRAARVLFSVAVAVVLAVVVVSAARHLSEVSLTVDVTWLVPGLVLALAAFPLLALGWAELLAASGHHLQGRTAVRLWALAQASRYLPTGLAAVASRAVLAAREGIPRSVTVATIVVEGLLLVSWSAAAGGLLLASPHHAAVAPVAIAGAAGIVAVPAVLVATRRLSPRVVAADAVVGVNMAVKGAAFLLLARALLPVHAADTALLFGAVNVAVVAGMVGVTPAGLGVREGVLAALLGHRFGIADATALAVALRAWDLAVELPWVGAAVVQARRAATR